MYKFKLKTQLRRISFYSLYMTMIFTACGKSSESLSPDTSRQMVDYFPELQIEDTSTWLFSQFDKVSSGGGGHYWHGETTWKVTAIEKTDNSRIVTIQRIFSGSIRHVILWPDSHVDTTTVLSDTSYFKVEEGVDHKITLDLRGNSGKYEYFGDPITFNRYYPLDTKDTVTITSGSENAKSISVIIVKNCGLIKYQTIIGSMTGYGSGYERLE